MKTAGFIIGLLFAFTVGSFGQVRTINNASLEKFQQKRLAAERDYRDNYARMGFPSPEELERQREADLKARLELAEQLRQARLEKERIELERRGLDLQQRNLDMEAELLDAQRETGNVTGFYGGYVGGFGGIGGFGFGDRRGRFRRDFNRFGNYRATPFGIIPVPNPPRPQRVLRRSGPHIRRHR